MYSQRKEKECRKREIERHKEETQAEEAARVKEMREKMTREAELNAIKIRIQEEQRKAKLRQERQEQRQRLEQAREQWRQEARERAREQRQHHWALQDARKKRQSQHLLDIRYRRQEEKETRKRQEDILRLEFTNLCYRKKALRQREAVLSLQYQFL